MLELYQTNAIPKGFLTAEADCLHTILPNPTLFERPGKITEPLFVSILLHGNEPTGLKAVQLLLQKYANRELPRSLSIFIGNVTAAKTNLRRLDGQPDYNRVWPGTETPDCPEARLAQQVFDLMQQRKVFASIDIHNNTGLNPHYACINSLDGQFLRLAALFGRLVVYFTRPKGVQSAAFANLCPSVTLECGRPDQHLGVSHAFDYLENCLHLQEFPHHPLRPQDIDLFHTVAQVKIVEGRTFSFSDANADLLLDKNLEQLNFTEIPTGTILGIVKQDKSLPLVALDESGNDVSHQSFRLHRQQLQIARPTMPSMLTLNEEVIRQDCLCYLMERLDSTSTLDNPASPQASNICI